MKTKIVSIIAILTVLCVICYLLNWSFYGGLSENGKMCQIQREEKNWKFEIADTSTEREKGLMNREKMCETCGMLFMFEAEKPQGFWMKNTFIPLDIYFYDVNGKMVDSALNMRPEKETGEPMRYISKPAQYVLELNVGTKWDHDILPCIQ